MAGGTAAGSKRYDRSETHLGVAGKGRLVAQIGAGASERRRQGTGLQLALLDGVHPFWLHP
jgi:hypothetical protein